MRYILSNMIVRQEVAPSTEGKHHVREEPTTSHEKVPEPKGSKEKS